VISVKTSVGHLPNFDPLIMARNIGKAVPKSKAFCRWAIEPTLSGYKLSLIMDSALMASLGDRIDKALKKSMAAWVRWMKKRGLA
jgi:ribosomal protein S26